MSLFSWFTRKPSRPRSRMAEPSGLLSADPTVPLASGRGGKPLNDAVPAEQAASRKNERMERRELLYVVVRDAMVRAGVLSASYKFKVLSLDPRGQQFLVMMDLAREYGGETVRLSEIEALIAQTAKLRYDIAVSAVYWRINDHVAVGIAQKGVAPHGAGLTPAAPRPPLGAAVRPTPAPAPPVAHAASAASAPLMAPRFDPIEADEVAAFKRALAAAAARAPVAAAPPGVAVRSGGRRAPLGSADFADTEMPEQDSRAQSLSTTQYGDL